MLTAHPRPAAKCDLEDTLAIQPRGRLEPAFVLQVMPWPTYHSMTDADLKAIYAYLTAIPPATACNTVADGCPGFSGAAASSANYVFKDTPDCPNGANGPPPQ